jgi:hypothetical protein
MAAGPVLLLRNEINLPFTAERLHFLRALKAGEFSKLNWSEQSEKKIAHLETLVPGTNLPAQPDMKAIEALHQEILEMELI